MTTPDEVKRLERELCDIERRACIGKAQGFDVRDARRELHAAIDALAGQAVPAQPVAWRIRETNPEYPEPCPWHYREQSERPYCSWKYHEMQPLYASSPQAAQPVARRVRKIGGSFQHTGTVVAEFETTAGERRIVIEFDPPVAGMLHVYRPDQVAMLAASPQADTQPREQAKAQE